jgi:hypothetical protein
MPWARSFRRSRSSSSWRRSPPRTGRTGLTKGCKRPGSARSRTAGRLPVHVTRPAIGARAPVHRIVHPRARAVCRRLAGAPGASDSASGVRRSRSISRPPGRSPDVAGSPPRAVRRTPASLAAAAFPPTGESDGFRQRIGGAPGPRASRYAVWVSASPRRCAANGAAASALARAAFSPSESVGWM